MDTVVYTLDIPTSDTNLLKSLSKIRLGSKETEYTKDLQA